MDSREIIKPYDGFSMVFQPAMFAKGKFGLPRSDLPGFQSLSAGEKKPTRAEVKGVQRQFRNKTKAVLKPLFKVG